MRGSVGDRQRLTLILDAITSIENFITGVTKEQFLENYMLQLAVTKLLENIGESANRISSELKSEFPDVDWAIIVRSRNVFVHQYFALDLDVIWQTANSELHQLKESVTAILRKKFP
jgi:uncharacterized protein with HEPN domain